MSSKPPLAPRSTAKRALDIVSWCAWLLGFFALIGWLYKAPAVYPSVSWITATLSPLTTPLLHKLFGVINPTLQTVVTLLILVLVLLFLATPFTPIVERQLIRGWIRKGERQADKIQRIRDSMDVKLRPKDHNTARWRSLWSRLTGRPLKLHPKNKDTGH